MVWSDPEIQKLSREFVTVADEVYMLYPEDRWNLDRVKDRPEHQFFKRYGEAMPKGDWNHPGTKQGLYMIGPDGEYLEGKFAASGLPDDIQRRMERALERWDALRRKKRYANKPVPMHVTTLPARVDGKEFVLRVHSRDLPRGKRDRGARRFDPSVDQKAGWMDFTEWAWNENWMAVDDWRALVPTGKLSSGKPSSGKHEQEVDAALVRRIAREMLIDNVRGQAGKWPKDAVKVARLTMTGTRKSGRLEVRYRGEVTLDDGTRSMQLQLLGDAVYDPKQKAFRELRIAAVGMRKGAHRFNQRSNDPGPAPIGFSLTMYRAPEAAGR